MGVLLCFLHLKHLLYHCGKLLLGEGAMLDVGGEVAQLLQGEEGGLEGLLRPNTANPVPSCLNSLFSRAVDDSQLGDYILHIFISSFLTFSLY